MPSTEKYCHGRWALAGYVAAEQALFQISDRVGSPI